MVQRENENSTITELDEMVENIQRNVALTVEELREIQVSAADKILDINKNISDGRIPDKRGRAEIAILSSVIDKCSESIRVEN